MWLKHKSFFDCSVLWFTVAFREVVLRFIYACRHTKRIAVVGVPKCCTTSAAKVRLTYSKQQNTDCMPAGDANSREVIKTCSGAVATA